MKLLLALCVTGCATAPVPLEQAFQSVNTRASYSYYTGWDKRVLQAGETGNCAAFAHSYQDEAMQLGVPTFVTSCVLRNGQEHAYTITYDRKWALDVRQRQVVPVNEVGCR